MSAEKLKHTPGPWFYGIAYTDTPIPIDYKSPGFYDNAAIIGANGETIAGCAEYNVFSNTADIQLMIAAPDLLAALEKSVRYLADLNGCDWIKGDSVAGLDMRQRAKSLQSIVFSAISKAKGEA